MVPLDEETLEKLKSIGGPRTLADVQKLVRAYVYGDPGVGKTDFFVKICRELNLSPIWVTADSGYSTVLKYPDVAERTYFTNFDSFSQLRLLAQAHDEGHEPFCNYDTLIWDTVSTSVNNTLRELVKIKPLSQDNKPITVRELGDPSLAIEAWGHYRMVESLMKTLVPVLNKSGMHIFYSAHIRDPTDKDKEKKRFAIRPAGPEATYRVIAQEANLLGWLYKEGKERLIQFEPTLRETAKTQIPTIQEKTYKVTEVPELLNKYVNS